MIGVVFVGNVSPQVIPSETAKLLPRFGRRWHLISLCCHNPRETVDVVWVVKERKEDLD